MNIGRHAGPVVGHADRDVLAGLHVALACAPLVEPVVGGFDGNAATVRHGVARVDAEIEKRVLKLIRIAQRRP